MTPVNSSLRFGIMCHGTTFPLWQARCIQTLVADGVEPAVLIIDDRPPLPGSSVRKKIKTLVTLQADLFSLYNRHVVQRRCRATVPVDLSDSLQHLPRIPCQVLKKGKFSEYFSPQDLDAIRGCHLDFVLRFAFNIIRGEILTVPRYGVWSFHHGDEQKYRGAPPCFWEIYRDEPETGAILQRLTERLDGGVVLKKGTFATVLHSYPQSRDAAHMLGTTWPAEVCRDIRDGQARYLDDPPTRTTAPIYLQPGNRQMIAFGFKQIGHQVNRPTRWARDGNAGFIRT